MGKTKTAFVQEQNSSEKSGKEAYEEKMRKKAEKEAAAKAETKEEPAETKVAAKPETPKKQGKKEKDQVKGVGLKGGERIKVIGAELPEEETPAEAETTPTPSEAKSTKKPKVRSNKYKAAYTKVDKNKFYKLEDAISLLKGIKYSKFDETIELHFVLKSKGQPVNITLPHSGMAELQKRQPILQKEKLTKLKACTQAPG